MGKVLKYDHELIGRLVEEGIWNARQVIEVPVLWKVNCCRKRHTIALARNGSLKFLQHPTSADWEKVRVLQAMHRQAGGGGFACRCEEVRWIWRSIFCKTANLSELPSAPGTAIRIVNADTLEVETSVGITMREAASRLLSLGWARTRQRNNTSSLQQICRNAKRTRERQSRDKRYTRGTAASLFAKYDTPLYPNKIRRLRNIRSIVLVVVDPATEEHWLESGEGSVRVCFYRKRGMSERVGHLFEWGWASCGSGRWKLETDSGEIVGWEPNKGEGR